MGSPWLIDANNVTVNHRRRRTAGGLTNGKRVGRQLEEIELFDDRFRAARGMNAVTRYRYDDDANEGWAQEPGGTGDVYREEYDPSAAFDGLLHCHRRIAAQYNQVAKMQDMTDAGGDPAATGLYQRLTGANSLVSFATLDAGGVTACETQPHTLAQLKTATTILYDEDLNILRPKLTIATLHTDRIKIWEIFGCMFPSASGVDSVELGPENLVGEALLRDEYFGKLTGATGFGRRAGADGFYVAFGSTLRNYDQYLRPVAFTGSTYAITPTVGSGVITAVEYMGSRVWFIRGGFCYFMTTTGTGQTKAVWRDRVSPASNPEISGFTDLIKGAIPSVVYNDQLLHLNNGDTATLYQDKPRFQLSAAGKKVVLLPYLVPLVYYFNSGGGATWGTGDRAFNMLEAQSGGDGQVYGTHQRQINLSGGSDDVYTIRKFTDTTPTTTYSLQTGRTIVNADNGAGLLTEDRTIIRVDPDALDAEAVIHTDIGIRLNTRILKTPYSVANPGVETMRVSDYTGSFPPSANATDFNALGATLEDAAVNMYPKVAGILERQDSYWLDLPNSARHGDGKWYLMLTMPNFMTVNGADPNNDHIRQLQLSGTAEEHQATVRGKTMGAV